MVKCDTKRADARRPSRFLWLLPALVTLLVHAAFVVESQRHVAFQFPLIDAAGYHQQAATAAGGHALAEGPFWQPPLFPFALSLVYRFVTQDYFGVRLLQALVAAVTSVLVYVAARFFLTRRLAALAGCMFGLYGPMLFFSSQLLPAGLAAALNVAALAASLALLRQPHWGKGLLAGVLIGLAALTVPNILVVLPGVLVFAGAAYRRRADRDAWPALLCILLGAVLTILPVSLRNWIVSGEWVPISTNGGINLYIGNNPQRDETIAVRPGIDWDRLASTPAREGISRNATESERYFVREVLHYVRARPGSFLSGLACKARELLTGREIPRNLDLYTVRGDSHLLSVLAWRLGSFGFPFGLLGPLAGVGVVLTLRKSAASGLLGAWILLYLSSVVLFFPASRYLMPVIPALLIAGVVGGRCIWNGLTDPERMNGKPAALMLGLVVVFALPVKLPTDRIDFDAERRLYTGIAQQTRGRGEEALRQYDAVLASDPGMSDAWFYRGTLLREAGRTDEAIESHREALRLRPDHYRAMNDLAVILFKRGQSEEAVALLRKSVELDPLNRQTARNLSVGLIALGQIEEANVWRERLGEAPVRQKWTAMEGTK